MGMFDELDSSSNDSLQDITDVHFETKPNVQPFNAKISTRPYQCSHCLKSFCHRRSLTRHEKSTHESIIYRCTYCHKTFHRSDVLTRHVNSKHQRSTLHRCMLCQKTFSRLDHLTNHLKTHTQRQRGEAESGSSNIEPPSTAEPIQPGPSSQPHHRREIAFNGLLVTEWLNNTTGQIYTREFMKSKRDEFINLFKDELKATDSDILHEEKPFKTAMDTILKSTDFEAIYEGVCEQPIAESEDSHDKETGRTLEEILHIEIRLNKFHPLRSPNQQVPSAGEIKIKQEKI